ncbi:MAG: thrombospondin type 3 repeat-containing protein [Gammaproteobacteria bacterium]
MSLGNTPVNYLGRSTFVADPYFSGSIAEFRIYDHALSPDGIFASYRNGPDALGNCPIASMSSAPDVDSDGIPDLCDSCISIANPRQEDSDGDGYGNACDPDFNNNGIVDSPGWSL